MTKATESALSELHGHLARALTEIVKGAEVQEVVDAVDEDGELIRKVITVRKLPTAAELQAAAKFLKDNSITADPGESAAIGELEQALAERRAKRTSRPALAEIETAARLMRGA